MRINAKAINIYLLPVLGIKGYKYKFIIASLISGKKAGRRINIPRTMTLNV